MTTLYDLVDKDELDRLMSEGRINKQVHPKLPLSIYNYSAKSQFANEWLNAERVCRGLIVEDGTNKVIARGPSKFFNYGQTGAPEVALTDKVWVSKKEDGSLGIAYVYGDHVGIATRGSFASDQAIRASSMLDKADKLHIRHLIRNKNHTPIFEVVYPSNRIVLDYKGLEKNIKLGHVNNETGLIEERNLGVLYGDTLASHEMTFADALALPIPDDEEGYVLDVRSFDTVGIRGHIKLKGEEYKLLHGLLTNTNARRIWVQMAARACHHWVKEENDWARFLKWDPADFARVNVEKDMIETYLTNVPDEFYSWVTKKIDSINDNVSDMVIQAVLLAGQIAMVDDKQQRFELVKHHPLCREILAFLDSRDESRIILKAWQLAKPEGDDTPFKTKGDED